MRISPFLKRGRVDRAHDELPCGSRVSRGVMRKNEALVVVMLVVVVGRGAARELDPAACAARFDVQHDKIIRTEESREMGARYLSELDVGARHECLRLCCETEACDVFVYEEKGPGSCYLFECGPPEDFRCKFTAHNNFSSGVLALSRRLAELQDQELRAHHERDLLKLRSGSSTTVSSTTAVTSSSAPPPLPIQSRPPHSQESPRRCSRYQFECRRGGECIAVYNACDGVPQCADGSDEALELGCPVPLSPAGPAPSAPTHPRAPTPPPMPIQDGSGGDVSGSGGTEHWPHRLAQAQSQSQHRYTVPESAVSSHIFSHKGGLVQEPEGGAQYEQHYESAPAPDTAPAAAGPGVPALWSRRPWPLQPLQLQPGAESVPDDRVWGPSSGPGAGSGVYWPEPESRRAWPVPQLRPDPDIPVYLPPKTMPEIPVQYGVERQALRDGPKKGFDLNNKPEPMQSPVPPRPDRLGHTKLDNAKPSQTAVAATVTAPNKPGEAAGEAASETGGAYRRPEPHRHYALEEQHEGLSERPPAALLLLVLGVLMTSVLGAMLACRARAARRRLRRGKSSFAHDADYLVNGMYL